MKKLSIAVLVLAAAAAILYAATLAQAGFECEACVLFEGRRACGTARAGSVAEARRTALTTACATVTSGVTSTLRCQAEPPLSLDCRLP